MNDLDKDIHTARETNNPVAKILWIILGSFFVVVGAIGAIIPGLPTTLFLILAAACYIRSSQKLYDWLITNKTFGPYLKDYREGRGMPRNAKILAVSMIILFAGYAVIFAIDELIIKIIVAVSGLIGIFYVTFKVPVVSPRNSRNPETNTSRNRITVTGRTSQGDMDEYPTIIIRAITTIALSAIGSSIAPNLLSWPHARAR